MKKRVLSKKTSLMIVDMNNIDVHAINQIPKLGHVLFFIKINLAPL